MHAKTLLHNHLKKSCQTVNKATLKRLINTSSSLLTGCQLSLSSLGRSLSGKAHVKHKIKAVDRLLRNNALYCQRQLIYQGLSQMLIRTKKSIAILVDWSPCGNRQQQILRASLFHQSRSAVLYEEVHPEVTDKRRTKIEIKFLQTLQAILPQDIQVTVITDAGFRCPWFKQVLAQGWDFEGRVRGNTQYSLDGKSWEKAVNLYKKATNRAQFVGSVFLTKGNKLACQMYLYREKKCLKKQSKRPRLSSGCSKKYHKAETTRVKKKSQDPWIIVTSKSHQTGRANEVMNSYKRRMKIEHDFRNTKNIRWGIGLEAARSAKTKRLEILLLIGALAMFILWLIGFAAEQKDMQKHFQANTIRTHRVLSLIFLGMQVYRHCLSLLKKSDYKEVLRQLQGEVHL